VRRNGLAHGTAAALGGLAAVPLSDQALRWTPLEQRAAFRDAVAEVEAGQFAEALPTLRTLAKAYPTSPLARLYLARSLDESDEPYEADRHATALVNFPDAGTVLQGFRQADPNLAFQCSALGDSMVRRGQNLLARRIFELTLQLDPANRPVRFKLALCLEHFKRYREAHTLLSTLIDEAGARPRPDDRVYLSSWYPARAHFAVRLGEEQWRHDPHRAPRAARTFYDAALGDLQAADRILQPTDHENLTDRFAAEAEARIALGDLETRLDHPEAAVREFRRAKAAVERMNPREPGDVNRQLALTERANAGLQRANPQTLGAR
jgi:tetratricopeptide (TPR) repeat protein